MGPKGARNQPQSARQQDQHDQRIEQAGRLKIDVQVGNHAGQNKKRSAAGQQPPDGIVSAKKQDADADQHGHQGDAESVAAVKVPVGTSYHHLIGQEVASYTRHGEAKQKAAQASRGAADVSERMV